MKTGEQFERLSEALNENTSYVLNEAGDKLILSYHGLIGNIEKVLTPLLENIAMDPVTIAKQAAIQLVSTINSSKAGTEIFDLMSRLDTLTNGGQTAIHGDSFAFNQNDKILQYLDKA